MKASRTQRPYKMKSIKENRLVKTIMIVAVMIATAVSNSRTIALSQQAASQSSTLEGVWEARHYFAPSVEGPLEIVEANGNWSAQIGQFAVPVNHKEGRLSLELPGGQHRFDGRLAKDGSSVRGHWINWTIDAQRGHVESKKDRQQGMGAACFNANGEDQDSWFHKLRRGKHSNPMFEKLRISLVAFRFPVQRADGSWLPGRRQWRAVLHGNTGT